MQKIENFQITSHSKQNIGCVIPHLKANFLPFQTVHKRSKLNKAFWSYRGKTEIFGWAKVVFGNLWVRGKKLFTSCHCRKVYK